MVVAALVSKQKNTCAENSVQRKPHTTEINGHAVRAQSRCGYADSQYWLVQIVEIVLLFVNAVPLLRCDPVVCEFWFA